MSEELHSPYGPSASHKWLYCPGSIQAEKDLPDKQTDFAKEGALAHELAETCLKTYTDCREYIGKLSSDNFTVDEEMADYIQEYVDYVRNIGGSQEYEQSISYDDYVPDGFGTADAIAVESANINTLHVIDLKYGKGVPVDAEKNPQGQLYALGALLEREVFQKFDKVVIHIVQPRLNSVSNWETTPDALHKFGQFAKERYAMTLEKDAKRVPGDGQCRWCKAKATCYALADRTEHALMRQFDEIETSGLRAPEKLSDEDLQFVLNYKDLIINWIKSVEKLIVDRLLNGQSFEGFKLVAGRSNRKWSNDEEAEKTLSDLLGKTKWYNKKLLSVAQAEKALGKRKDKIADLIIKPEGSPTLVFESDKRQPLTPAITAEDF